MARLFIATPARPGARTGNLHTAQRWARLLRRGGHRLELEAAEELPENAAYTSFVLETGLAGDALDLAVALMPCTVGYGEIGARLVVQEPDVPRLIDRLEQKGWVTRRREVEDRRCVRVHLTKTGRTLVDGLDAPILAMHRRQFAALSASRLQSLLDALLTIQTT